MNFTVQDGLDSSPEMEGFEIAATSIPAREVSGDFYTYLSLGKNTGVVLADVTGKSVGSCYDEWNAPVRG